MGNTSRDRIKKLIWYVMALLVIGLCTFAVIELSTLQPTLPVIILDLLSVFALATTTTMLILKIAYKKEDK